MKFRSADGDTEREELECTAIWQKYQQGVRRLQNIGLYAKTRKAYRFFEGDQWSGLESGGEAMPIYNIIQPVVEHKSASVAMNGMEICYTPLEYGDYNQAARACQALNRYAARQWELLKMDKLSWQAVKDACIAGDSYLYFYNKDLGAQVIDNASIYFADETSADIQRQPWIIIAERRFLRDVKREARENGLSQQEIDGIGADQDTDQLLGEDARKNQALEEQRCTSLLYMSRNEEGVVQICRSVKSVIYQKDVLLQAKDKRNGQPLGRGMTLYPVAGLVWVKKKGSARGVGEAGPLIANQIEINKMLARRLMNAKLTAFGRLVYNSDRVLNPDGVNKVGTPIRVKGIEASRVTDLVAYLHPSPMSQDAKNLTDEMISQTRDLAGAGDAALGQINPENASGAAIIAVRDQAALPLNEQIADYKQLCEDVAAIWYELWATYHPMGMEIELPPPRTGPGEEAALPERESIPAEVLQQMRVNIRIDVSPANPYSKYAQEQALGALFQSQAISFEEYVEALDENAAAPKGKLREIVKRRQEQAAAQAEAMQATVSTPAQDGGIPAGALQGIPAEYPEGLTTDRVTDQGAAPLL